MKIVQVNCVCGKGSTGKICVAVSDLLTHYGIENYILYSNGYSDHSLGIKYMYAIENKIQALKSRIFGNYGFQSKLATRRLIKKLEEISPDIIHLHNLHSHNVHLGMLFSYLRNKQIKIFWTFHDCWAFTAYCMYYDMVGCSNWKTSCKKCPLRRRFSWFFDRSQYLYSKKKELFKNLDLTIITPSQWLANQVKKSFLREYEVKVINNGIDLSIFHRKDSNFRKKYQIEDKFIILGVAFNWEPRKGLDVFINLSNSLDDRFKVVLIGTDDEVDKLLPLNIISIHRTSNQAELAEIYSSADLFVNPTREENFPTTNLEAIACGTPVLTFCTGGSPEMLDEKSGIIVDRDDQEALYNAIIEIERDRNFRSEDCRTRAEMYDQAQKYSEYVELYKSIV